MDISSKDDRISVILPTHNRPDMLSAAINSVLGQTYDNWVAWIVDDASQPPAEIPTDPRIHKLRREISIGGAGSKNAGASLTDSEILAFLDDDDLYAPTYLQRAAEVLKINPEVDVVFMGVSWFGPRGQAGQAAYDQAMQSLLAHLAPETTTCGALLLDGKRLFSSLLRTVPMAFQRPVVRRAAYQRIGPYQTDILLWDCDWALRAALETKCALLPEGLYLQRAEGQGFSSRQDRRTEHLKSNVLMKERLFSAGLTREQQRTVRKSLAELWFGAAWSSYQEGAISQSLEYLWSSAKIKPGFAHLKLLTRLSLRRFGLGSY